MRIKHILALSTLSSLIPEKKCNMRSISLRGPVTYVRQLSTLNSKVEIKTANRQPSQASLLLRYNILTKYAPCINWGLNHLSQTSRIPRLYHTTPLITYNYMTYDIYSFVLTLKSICRSGPPLEICFQGRVTPSPPLKIFFILF